MPTTLRSNEDSVLFALWQATIFFKKDCLNPQEIVQFLLPEARIGSLEPWESTVEIADRLIGYGFLKKCEPEPKIEDYEGYMLSRKGGDYAQKLQLGDVSKGL